MKILMLGNSYTYFFDMPKILQGLFDANGVDAQVDSITAGGRVLGAVAVEDCLADAVAHAYCIADKVEFENAYKRRDIGQRALAAKQN